MRFLLGVLLSAVALFLWGFVFWTVLPYANQVFKDVPNEETVVEAMRANITEPGAYLIPGGDPTDEAHIEKHRQGPIAVLMYQPTGAEPMDRMVFIKGFLHMLGSSLLLGIILASAGRRSYLGRFLLCFWVSLFVAIWSEMSNVIWFRFPLSYACLQQTYYVTAWIIAGAILSFFVSPPADDSSPSD